MAAPAGPEDDRVTSWSHPEQVDGYLARVGRLEPRIAGEQALVSLLPAAPHSLLDLGCGDGRLAARVMDACPGIREVVAVDSSPAMLDHARARFDGDRRVTVRSWDLADPLVPLGEFDVIVSGFAIHHLEDRRKRSLLAEVALMLNEGGLFANLEVVQSATPELHREFLELIGRPDDDPEDRLTAIEPQLGWMRSAGLTRVDCFWRWRGFALLAGTAPVGERRGAADGE